MLKTVILIAVIFVLSEARPNSFKPLNVVTAPPNCKDGQEWVNGECRDIWKVETQNVVTVPANCQAGQEYINGQCRDVWLARDSKQLVKLDNKEEANDVRNIISVPANCENGQQWINGACRDIWRIKEFQPSNVVTVPPNCPDGQEYINGQCRDVWVWLGEISAPKGDVSSFNISIMGDEIHMTANGGSVNTMEAPTNKPLEKNVISVPTQCPNGYKPDANGVCREIWGF